MGSLVKHPNPYWAAVAEHVKPGEFRWEGPQVGRFTDGYRLRGDPDRHDMVAQYAWTITDPSTVAFVARWSRGRLVDPMAGTGYWAYVLGQLGVDVVSYDAAPVDNHWHRNHVLHAPVARGWGEVVIDRHPDRTLLLAWPPYGEPAGARILQQYRGDRVIYIGEGDGGCTGDDDMHNMLDEDWDGVACRTPVQWWGLHDRVYVYSRPGGA